MSLIWETPPASTVMWAPIASLLPVEPWVLTTSQLLPVSHALRNSLAGCP